MEEQTNKTFIEKIKTEPNTRKKFILALVLSVSFMIFYMSRSGPNGYVSTNSSSGESHTCLNCKKGYLGYGYATVGGQEYALDKNQGDQYCSMACAKASRTGGF